MNLTLTLDIVLVVLLLATIVYAMVLHRRLSMLRSQKEDLEGFLERMSQATAKADASLKGIRQAAEQAQGLLNDPLVKAQSLRDELLFLIERADGVAERMANTPSARPTVDAVDPEPARRQAASRPARRPAAAPDTPPRDTPRDTQPRDTREPDDGARSQAERDLMNALRNVR